MGRARMWADEWITYDELWSELKDEQVERLWLNILKWLTPPSSARSRSPTGSTSSGPPLSRPGISPESMAPCRGVRHLPWHFPSPTPHAHLLRVKTTIRVEPSGSAPLAAHLFMPVWTPGSYLVREYARHVEGLDGAPARRPARRRKIRKNAWRIEHDGANRIEDRYQLYANELTVRTNHVDATHAYWNGAATYLGARAYPQRRRAGHGRHARRMGGGDRARADGARRRAQRSSPRRSTSSAMRRSSAASSSNDRSRRSARRTASSLADNADARSVDWDKLEADTRTIVETEARLIAGDRSPEDALPYDGISSSGTSRRAGAEGSSTATAATLMAKPASFQTRSGYLDVLSLIAHEYFHLWNVKRIRPAALSPYRYEEENYTRLLWWFEGATSYYDWRTLRLAKLTHPSWHPPCERAIGAGFVGEKTPR